MLGNNYSERSFSWAPGGSFEVRWYENGRGVAVRGTGIPFPRPVLPVVESCVDLSQR